MFMCVYCVYVYIYNVYICFIGNNGQMLVHVLVKYNCVGARALLILSLIFVLVYFLGMHISVGEAETLN